MIKCGEINHLLSILLHFSHILFDCYSFQGMEILSVYQTSMWFLVWQFCIYIQC